MVETVCSVSSTSSGFGHLDREVRALFFVSVCIPFHYLLSFWVIPSYTINYQSWCWVLRRPMFIFLLVQALKGNIFVVLWWVALYCLRKWGNWVFQLNPSTVVARIYLFRVHTKCSASPFASDHKGVILLCLKPDWGAKSLKSFPEMEGHCQFWQWWDIPARRRSEISVHGATGSGVVCMGSRCVCFGFKAWQVKQLCTISSTSLSIPGNHIFSLISCFVLTMLWCEWWAMSIVLFLNLEGITRRCPRKIRPLITDSSSLNGEKFDNCGSFQHPFTTAAFTFCKKDSSSVAFFTSSGVIDLVGCLVG